MKHRHLLVALVAGSVSVCMALPAQADEESARSLFKAMSDYLISQQDISFTYDANLEIVSSDLQKLGFASSGALTLNRPDKLRMTRTGGFVDVELTYDGETLAVMGKNQDAYAKEPMTGSVEAVIEELRSEYGLPAPAADLLSSNPYEIMMSNVTDVKDLGSGVIGGKECDHLAFRTEDTDWEIWIAQGDEPHPCRFTITSKMMAQAPSYTIVVKEWRTGEAVAADDFQLNTGDATETTISELSAGLDEIQNLSGKGDAQ